MADTSWSFNGTDLSTFGVITMLDDYLDLADKRGEDQVIPYKDGSIFVEKYYSGRTISFGMAIKKSSNETLEDAIDDLKKLLSPRSQKDLSNTRADGSVRTILASMESTLQFQRESYNFARVVISFKCSNPFFRGEDPIADNTTTIDADPKTLTVDNTGTVEETDPIIILTGPLENVIITHPTNGSIFKYMEEIQSPRVVTVQTVNGEYVATDDLGANLIGNVQHEGSFALLVVDTGVNNFEVNSDVTTTGEIQITFYPPYL